MKVIYISHPYGGEENNRTAVDKIILKLGETFPDAAYFSPLHALRRPYDFKNYDRDLDAAIEIMKRCDAVFFTGIWSESTGCREEFETANKLNMRYFCNTQSLMKYLKGE
ncbi:hypothetical protein AB840_15125 [Megasphaera cerevisiae DSM 20462]|uniref:DUF4406 domain-containing protein n=1 Tax=Megasphaera cerevisiae DSM 20462 TaxID=1122219 RepID=A0A0J6WRP0_9FIRM|nr:DUF4406 domain-containing protein [Megasphaera cerevisiae]KMO85174.1 hypothetical protein AB840_15125 [Megasphaera cerevisiae DSM 20462]SKA02250.1 protein of unknown function [Megasphaera cerevisiae DSM 20462]SKA21921.1 protein of unknown function [Megasphaera cerevisiae DSM 20462]SKA25221.1 protein of unknown function [Megasphaera cerevisiae DSM 20462]